MDDEDIVASHVISEAQKKKKKDMAKREEEDGNSKDHSSLLDSLIPFFPHFPTSIFSPAALSGLLRPLNHRNPFILRSLHSSATYHLPPPLIGAGS
ncbi:hypothetical protein MTR_5g089895 [Medicago truncatula]|uniref:Uncharacterized protein n=1 Tax=Medicago truncatula TaxID=3880 RepID=A0A072UG59_MEDTR|nr:hypothetical protein MTR_5g089895 [Medicago truncatula]